MEPPKANYGALWPLIVGLIAALVLGLLIVQMAQDNSSASTAPGRSVIQVSVTLTVETPPATTSEVPTLPATQTPWNEATQSAEETERYIATVLADRHSVLATAYQRQTDQPIVLGTPPTGILEGGGADFHYPNHDVIIKNHWQDVINENGEWASMYAGSLYTDPTHGLVLVITQGPLVTYLTPIKAGALRIVDVQNLHLVLLSDGGTTFYFDVLGQSFVDSLTEVAPTVTPYRSSTPTPTETMGPSSTPAPTCTPGPTPATAPPEGLPCS
jgi:hypothetical protein